MKLSVEIETDNEAFYPHPKAELARILRCLAAAVEHGTDFAGLMDRNGNRVGSAVCHGWSNE